MLSTAALGLNRAKQGNISLRDRWALFLGFIVPWGDGGRLRVTCAIKTLDAELTDALFLFLCGVSCCSEDQRWPYSDEGTHWVNRVDLVGNLRYM